MCKPRYQDLETIAYQLFQGAPQLMLMNLGFPLVVMDVANITEDLGI